MLRAFRLVPVLLLCWFLGPSAGTDAQASENSAHPLTIYVAGTAGGGIDLYARLVARHLGRHMPGNPSVSVQVMPGAGGIRAANYLAKQAPRDASVIATFAGGPVIEPLIGVRDPGYDMSRFTWVGALAKDQGLCVSWAGSPFKTIDDARRGEMVVAGTGAGSETDTWPVLLNKVLGTKFKLVTGYLGTQETLLAIERGEADGRCVISYSALKIAKPDWLREHKIIVLTTTSLEKLPDFPNAPAVVDLVTKDEDRALVELFTGPAAMARSFAGPPGLAPNTTAILRRAFDATVEDPEFRAEAAKMQAELAPSTGEDVQQRVGRLYATAGPVIARAKRLFAP